MSVPKGGFFSGRILLIVRRRVERFHEAASDSDFESLERNTVVSHFIGC
jgi:hypothetical protein